MVADPLPPGSEEVTLRPAGLADAAAFASLATQLGYPSSPRQVEDRMTSVLDDPKHLIIAAVSGATVMGWVHAYVCNLLESDAYAEVGGFVVDESRRGQGVGVKLMERVEDWARQIGCSAVSVRSSVVRHEAHKFYTGRGFVMIKTQHAFRKPL
ncbi:MAG: GNAT family N-acetyltransferase [Terriglobia bacterium]